MGTEKYRFWNIFKEQYEYIGQGYDKYALWNGKVYEVGGYGGIELFEVDYAKLEQFTGLLDINGQEVYQNDILRFNRLEGYSHEFQSVQVFKHMWATADYSFGEIVERGYVFEVVGHIERSNDIDWVS